jgi:hypothetical protein
MSNTFDEGVEVATDAIRSGVGLVALKRRKDAFAPPLT